MNTISVTILEDFKEEEADLIYKANIEGRDIIFYILLELQSKVDFRMANKANNVYD